MKPGKITLLATALTLGMAASASAQTTSSGQPGAATVSHAPNAATGGSQSSGQPVTMHKKSKHRPRAAHTSKKTS